MLAGTFNHLDGRGDVNRDQFWTPEEGIVRNVLNRLVNSNPLCRFGLAMIFIVGPAMIDKVIIHDFTGMWCNVARAIDGGGRVESFNKVKVTSV